MTSASSSRRQCSFDAGARVSASSTCCALWGATICAHCSPSAARWKSAVTSATERMSSTPLTSSISCLPRRPADRREGIRDSGLGLGQSHIGSANLENELDPSDIYLKSNKEIKD